MYFFFCIFALFIIVNGGSRSLGPWNIESLQWSFWQLQGKFLCSFFLLHILGL